MIKNKIVLGVAVTTLLAVGLGINSYNKYNEKKCTEYILQQKIEAKRATKTNNNEILNKDKVKEIQQNKAIHGLSHEEGKIKESKKEITKNDRVSDKNKEIDLHKSVKRDRVDIKHQESIPDVKKNKNEKPEKVGYVYLEGEGATEELANLTNTYLSYVPKNVMNNFVANGWKVVLTDKNIAETYYHDKSLGKIVGLTMSEAKTIYILASKNAIKSSTLHEMGHFVDIQMDVPSNSEEFLEDFNNEKDTFEVYSFDGHYKRNHFEFFAEVFQESILNPNRCKKSANKTYDFVKNQVKMIN
ncbi:hypothetical protein [Clostridium perfringens]|uniref:hypothetical protein n=1 Tax=Clostridium perfringens TaxID=1502 RepID=UPI00189AFC2A|nr:hypothetical protein [Clostridium perfringens]